MAQIVINRIGSRYGVNFKIVCKAIETALIGHGSIADPAEQAIIGVDLHRLQILRRGKRGLDHQLRTR